MRCVPAGIVDAVTKDDQISVSGAITSKSSRASDQHTPSNFEARAPVTEILSPKSTEISVPGGRAFEHQSSEQSSTPVEITWNSPAAPSLLFRRETSLLDRSFRGGLALPNTYRPAERFSHELKQILRDWELLQPFPTSCQFV